MSDFVYTVRVTTVTTQVQVVQVRSSDKLPRTTVREYAEEIAADRGNDDGTWRSTVKSVVLR